MAEQREHPLNRHLFIADNLNLLRALDNESIDLICIDPPFAKNQTFTGSLRPPLSEAERQQELETLAGWGIRSQRDAENAGIEWPEADNTGRFSDIWRWEDDVHEDWINRIEGDYPALAKFIDTARTTHSEERAAYLSYMAIRIIEMHRILKPTGSMYLHCDHSANAYLRMTLDSIFGIDNFRNEIIWYYKGAGISPRRWSRRHDSIFWYSKGDDWYFNADPVRDEYAESTKERFSHYIGNVRGDRDYGHQELNPKGKHPDDVWQIKIVAPSALERTGYPTQKPVTLGERIVLSSSNPGDVVLDCFAGCAYVPVAAERNGRQWIACDISPRALTVLRRQFAKFNYAVDGTQQTETPLLNPEANIITRGPGQLPDRSDEDPVESQDIKELPPRKFKVPASIIPEAEMLEKLLELSGYMAWCCGYANRMPDGSVIKTTRNFHLDHIDPKSKDGSNDIQNRAPLCPYHNTRKNNRRVHLADYRTEIADAGEMMVDTMGELINLAEAHHKAMQMYGQAYAARYGVGGD
ncbi:MAG: hypothetical protein F4X57_03715 [Chloroflexi bacterium]|nr:hypothetical protein [Chloroflexota bacterium]